MRTYNDRMGMVNRDRTPPVVEADGTPFLTRNGVIAVVPDDVAGNPWPGSEWFFAPIPEGVETVRL